MRPRINRDALDALGRADRTYRRRLEQAHLDLGRAVWMAHRAGNGWRAIGRRLDVSHEQARQLGEAFEEWATRERKRLDALPAPAGAPKQRDAEERRRARERARLDRLLGEGS